MIKDKIIKKKLDLINKRILLVGKSNSKGVTELLKNVELGTGKRVRGLLVLLTAECNSNKAQAKAVDLAAAAELLHHATLIHDDIVDSSDRRRGESTLYRKLGYEISVLAGDYLMSVSAKILLKQEDIKLYNILFDSLNCVCEGEVEEVYNKFNASLKEDEYFDIIGKKTAALIKASVLAGAYVGGIKGKQAELLGKFGYDIGMAFQIKDDILDITADPKTLGKPAGSDTKEGKATLPLILALKAAGNSYEKAAICKVFEDKKTAENSYNIIQFIKKFEGILSAQEVAEKYVKSAKKCLREVKVKYPERLKTLERIADNIVDRTY
jgi:geranylgeranyl pyrophosphate synthase